MNGVLDQQKVGEYTAAEYEEMTDVAERLRAPMDHPISFKNIDGKLHTESSVDGKDLLTISREAEFAALEMAKQNPQWAIEAYRRHLEPNARVVVRRAWHDLAWRSGGQLLRWTEIYEGLRCRGTVSLSLLAQKRCPVDLVFVSIKEDFFCLSPLGSKGKCSHSLSYEALS